MTISKYDALNNFQPVKQESIRPTPVRTYVVTPQVRGKSFAQVAPSVSPHVVSPKAAGGLKPNVRQNVRRDKRPNPLTVRLSDHEMESIRAKAAVAGCTLHGYCRASILGSDYKPKLGPELREVFLKLNLELTRQGNNLNQIARHVNSQTALPKDSESMLDVIGRSMLRTHSSIREALSQGDMEDA